MRGETAKTLISVKLCGILPTSGRSIQVLEDFQEHQALGENFPSVWGKTPNIHEYTSHKRGGILCLLIKSGRDLTFIISRCKIL
jgi:hypothetical protein